MKNPALRSEIRYEPATVIKIKQKDSLLEWLEIKGRLMPREQTKEKLDEIEVEREVDDLMDDDRYFTNEENS